MQIIEFVADDEYASLRIDKAVVLYDASLSRAGVQKMIQDGHVLVGGKAVSKNYKLKFGDRVCLQIPEAQPVNIEPVNMPLDIVYEDDDLLVVNKRKGLVVHPAPGHSSDTLVNGLLYHCGDSLSGINGEIRPGIVHRIDKDTSGLLMVAKNDTAHAALAQQIKEHSFKREYRAVVLGSPKEDVGVIDRPIGRNPNDRKKQCVNGLNARPAQTNYAVLERYRYFSYIRCVLQTGRTHQIRVHMASIGHPVAGDTVYGGEKNDFGLHGQCLHAAVLGFCHPRSGEYMEFTSELPYYFTSFLSKIKKSNW